LEQVKIERSGKGCRGKLDAQGLRVKKGVIQDATFIAADPGDAKADKPRGDEAKTKDGTSCQLLRDMGKEEREILLWIQAPLEDGYRRWTDQG